MVTIKNKYMLLAAGFWLGGIVLILLGAYFKTQRPDWSGPLLSTGLLAQAIGFGFFGFVLMQAVLKKKEK